MVDRIADAHLRSKVHDDCGLVFRKNVVDQRFIGNRAPDKDVPGERSLSRFFDQIETVFLQRRIIVVVHIVERNDRAAGELLQQPEHQIRADKAGRAGDEDRFLIEVDMHLAHRQSLRNRSREYTLSFTSSKMGS